MRIKPGTLQRSLNLANLWAYHSWQCVTVNFIIRRNIFDRWLLVVINPRNYYSKIPPASIDNRINYAINMAVRLNGSALSVGYYNVTRQTNGRHTKYGSAGSS